MACTLDVLCLEASPGQRLAVSGASPGLGSWDPTRAVPLTSSSQGVWTGAVPRQDANAKFKLLILNADGSVAAWEPLKHSRKWPEEAMAAGARLRTKYGKKRVKVDQGRSGGSWLDALANMLGCCLAPEQDPRSEMNLGPPFPSHPNLASTGGGDRSDAQPNDDVGQPPNTQALAGAKAKKTVQIGKADGDQASQAAGAQPAVPNPVEAKVRFAEQPPQAGARPAAPGGAAEAKADIAPKASPSAPMHGSGGRLGDQAASGGAALWRSDASLLPGQVVDTPAASVTPSPAQRPVAAATPAPQPKATPAPPAAEPAKTIAGEADAPAAAAPVLAAAAKVDVPVAATPVPAADTEVAKPAALATVAAPEEEKAERVWFLKPSVATWYQPVRKPADCTPPAAKASEKVADNKSLWLLKPSVATWYAPLPTPARNSAPSLLLAVSDNACVIIAEAAEAVAPQRQWARLPSVATWASIALPPVLATAAKKEEPKGADAYEDLLDVWDACDGPLPLGRKIIA